MAVNIRQNIPKDSILYINDINSSACERFKAQYSNHGPIEIVSTAREAAENAKILISIVPGAIDVKKVYLDENTGVIAARKDDERLFLECSTIDVESTREVGKTLLEKGMGTYIDTPVSGGVPAAERGDLSMLIGYPPPSDSNPTSRRLRYVLALIGTPSKFFYLHTLGAGLTAKIANNYLSGTILLATAEALAMGVKHGLDPTALYSVIKNSTGQSWMCDHVLPIPNVQTEYWVPSNSGYKPGFKTQMMLKDLGLGIESAKQVGVAPTMAEAALGVWENASRDERCLDRDGSSIYLHVGGILPEGFEDTGKKKEDGTWEFA
ncbi:6-phosphogluconate dehydrogenase C-terminal domain-like protein [Cucurbitaria berberidis CBS 394.84]|uniref:3-hydroxyisobutyrate dehydrogenase n=1 Tax=Cucurbitaria berberidis CBS 394.84 TaxID=1168544 RepID=A0A9P4L5X7_9PLEO|nr:6-phosphogluconate dehydrogenase C-terminal domain-like protein [Cucurbitaria berberidis CBS 394.84]KAF1842782.1 6-phosphogluconate dehydrogenase C-terminal domain-like protein [Cucurbitaria berberidis CBS 394.84]